MMHTAYVMAWVDYSDMVAKDCDIFSQRHITERLSAGKWLALFEANGGSFHSAYEIALDILNSRYPHFFALMSKP